TQRLIEAARTRGHTVRVLDPLSCYMRIAPDDFQIHYRGRELVDYDAVLPRIGASVSKYGTAVLRQFEMMGAYTPNPSDAILRARDKLRAHQLLAREGIALPHGPVSDAAIDDFIRAGGETVYHPVGSCRMGSDADAVVDTQLRVNGVEGLRVVDASVFPALINGNTNAPTIMIADRAADMILANGTPAR
ncbi:MAG: hypothetical protein KDK75_22855, partial [Alphaproteobacteria bacterium]|nr:hypothetical protein [Alphaproteobacteria bacterium]